MLHTRSRHISLLALAAAGMFLAAVILLPTSSAARAQDISSPAALLATEEATLSPATGSAIPAPAPAVAVTGQLRVSPVILNIKLDPGKTYVYDITLDNLTGQPLPVKLTFDSLDTEDGTGEVSFGAAPSPLLTWSEVNPDSLIIDAEGRRTVRVTVTIPDTVKLGGYYGILFVEPLVRSAGPGPQVSGKVGILMFANVSVGDTQRRAEITNWTVGGMLGDRQQAELTLRVRNRGLNHFTGTPRLLLQQWLGDPRTLVLEERILFPGKSRVWRSQVNMGEFPYGIYTATALVSVGNGETVQAATTIVSLPIVPALTGIGIILLLIIVSFRRKRFLRAIRILTGRK